MSEGTGEQPPPHHEEISRRADPQGTTAVAQDYTVALPDSAGQPARSWPGTAPGALRLGMQ
jgi:hypothetical protein